MATIAELAVNVVARTGGVQRGLKTAEQDLKRFKATASNIAAGIAAAFSIVSVRKLINDFAELGDQMDKMAQRTGVAVESLSALKFAAEQSGADIETLEKGFFGLSRAVFDLGRGSAEVTEAFGALGLSYEQLAALDPETQLLVIADAMNQFEDASTRGAIAQKIFGRAGRQLLPLLAGGADGIAELTKQAKDLGLTLSEEDAKAAAEFTDAMNELSSVLRGIGTQIAKNVTPVLTDLSRLFTSLDSGTRSHVVGLGLWVGAFTGALIILPKVVAGIKMIIGAYRALISAQIIQQALSGPKGWAVLAAGAGIAAAAVVGVNEALKGTNNELDSLERAATRARSSSANNDPTKVEVMNNDEIDNAEARRKYYEHQAKVEEELKQLRGDFRSQAILKIARLL